LVDLGPSSDEMTKWCVMSSDYIIPPTFTDRLSYSSVYGLINEVLPKWYKDLKKMNKKQVKRLSKNQNLNGYILNNIPKIFPLILTCYKVYGDTITVGNSSWIFSLETLMNTAPVKIKKHFIDINGKKKHFVYVNI